MPQFDITQFSSQIFWLILCFALLYSFVFFYTLPRLKKIERIRLQNTDKKIAQGNAYQEKIDRLNRQSDLQLAKAHDEAHQYIVAKTHEMNDHLNQYKIAIDQEIKIQYVGEEKAILKKFNKFSKLLSSNHEQHIIVLTDKIFKAYALDLPKLDKKSKLTRKQYVK